MFYFFSKTLNYLITPAGWLVALLLLAFFAKNPVRRRRLIGAGLGVFWLFGNPALINELVLQWEYGPAPVPTDQAAGVAVVLTGGIMNTLKIVPDARFLLDHEADRAGQALYLYKSGAVRKILISGGSGSMPFQRENVSDEGQMTARFLIISGVRPGDIVLENKSRNTRENAQFSARMLQSRFGTNHCVLITSGMHMRRAVACFRHENVQVTPFPGSFLSSRRSFSLAEFILPNEQTFADSFYLVKESAGYVVYWIMGYI